MRIGYGPAQEWTNRKGKLVTEYQNLIEAVPVSILAVTRIYGVVDEVAENDEGLWVLMNCRTSHFSLVVMLMVFCLWAVSELHAYEEIQPEELRIVIEGGRVEVNGFSLEWPVSIAEFTEIVGEDPRTDPSGGVWIWDSYGIKFLSYKGGTKEERNTKGNELTIYIKDYPDGDDSDGYYESRPKYNFRGTLVIDGVRITKNMTVKDVNKKKRGRKFSKRPQWWRFITYSKIPGRDNAELIMLAKVFEDLTIRNIYIWYEEIKQIPKNNENKKIQSSLSQEIISEETKSRLKRYKRYAPLIEADTIPETEKTRRTMMILLYNDDELEDEDRKIIKRYENLLQEQERQSIPAY